MKVKRIIYFILLIVWMITVFIFSSQPSDESSGTSGNTIRTIINLVPSIRKMESSEKEKIVEKLQPVARKLAHFTLYTVGGIIAALFVCEFNITVAKRLFASTLIGFAYSITDEIHQIFVPRKGWNGYRCIHRCSGSNDSEQL